MPFQSRAQQRFAFGTRKPWAKRWAKQTTFAGLPERKDAGTIAGAPVHGPGGLLSTPGLGTRRKPRKGRKWGMRLKDKQIVGNLYRSDTGQFSSGNGPKSDAPPAFGKPAKKPRKARSARARAPKPTDAERQQARDTKRQTNIDSVAKRMAESDTGLSPSGSAALTAFASGTQPAPEAGAQLAKMGLAEQAMDGSYRMSATGRAAVAAMAAGDYQRTVDAISRGTDTSGKREQRAQERTARQQATLAKRQATEATRAARREAAAQRRAEAAQRKRKKKPSSKKPTTDDRRPTTIARNMQRLSPTARRALGHETPASSVVSERPPATPAKARTKAAPKHTGVMVALYPDATAAKAIAAQKGVTEPVDRLHLTLAFLGDSSETALSTNKDKLIAAIKQWATEKGTALDGTINGLGRFFHSEDDDTNAVFVSPDVPGLPEMRQSLVDWIEQSGFDYAKNHGFTPHITVAYVLLKAPTPPIRVESKVTFDHVTLAWGDERYDSPLGSAPAVKSFIVFKDTSGRDRWIARTTTAYKDRDNEIISEDALDQDSQRMTATKAFGPLRWWHVGNPDPSNASNPAGPGLDIGDCDCSVVIGRTRVESGTFRDAGIARKVAQASDRLEMSPGFFHPLDQPDAAGVFHSMRTFERSVVPVRYGRASNLFTGFTVKEFRMEIDEMERRFKTMISEIGLSAEQAASLSQDLVATEKAASAQGIAFKDVDPNPDYPDIEINGVVYKAFPPKAAADDDEDADILPAAEEKAPPVMEEEITEEEIAEPEMEGNYIGDMGVDEFKTMLAELLAPVLKMQDMVKSMTDMGSELKTMYGGVATKDAGTLSEIASLKARLAEIEGNQPATILPDDVAAALKGAPEQPKAPDDPAKQAALNDPARPFAWLGMQTFPELYQNGENE